MGSKNRHAKELLPIILKDRKEGQWYVEPFVGGCNMIDKVDGLRWGNDYNVYLIAMWKALQNGWLPPEFVSEEDWRKIRENMDEHPKELVAFVRFGCSFGADWNGGYARNVRKDKPNAEILNRTTKSYCLQSKRNILKQMPSLVGVKFTDLSYDEMDVPTNSIVYCDPPYAQTTGYVDGTFDHAKFWQWCRDKVIEGHKVFISEYNAPEDFVCVWEKKVPVKLGGREAKQGVEKLFIHKDQVK